MRVSRLIAARPLRGLAFALLLGGLLLAGGRTARAQSSGQTVTYQRGWNLVGVPNGTDLSKAQGMLYTLQPGDTDYELFPTTNTPVSGIGYWAYFANQTQVILAAGASDIYSVLAPAGQYIMVGNPSGTQSAIITGGDVVYSYDPTNSANPYSPSRVLAAGQGAWVYSSTTGPVLVTPADVQPTPSGSQPPAGRFFGSVTTQGRPASAGADIVAKSASGATCGNSKVGAAPASGSNYALDIIGSDSGCTTEGATISFTVGGATAATSVPAIIPAASGATHVDSTVP